MQRSPASPLRLALMLAPALALIVGLAGGGLLYALAQSLGWQPLLGRMRISGEAYASLLYGPQYAEPFWRGLLLTLRLSLISTLLAAVAGVGLALLAWNRGQGGPLSAFVLQFTLPIPHLVAAIGVWFMLGQSGLISRAGAALGWFSSPADFPILVRDSFGLGIVLAYVWKEAPFVAVIALAALRALDTGYHDAAATLGANRWQRFRFVTLPLLMPGVLSASLLVFAFTFSAYEVPAALGVRFPQALSVLALRFFNDADLNARPQGMALALLISAIVVGLLLVYWGIEARRRAAR